MLKLLDLTPHVPCPEINAHARHQATDPVVT